MGQEAMKGKSRDWKKGEESKERGREEKGGKRGGPPSWKVHML